MRNSAHLQKFLIAKLSKQQAAVNITNCEKRFSVLFFTYRQHLLSMILRAHCTEQWNGLAMGFQLDT